jgi:hypothetical protein
MSKIWQLLFKRILFFLCNKIWLFVFTFICSHDYDVLYKQEKESIVTLLLWFH